LSYTYFINSLLDRLQSDESSKKCLLSSSESFSKKEKKKMNGKLDAGLFLGKKITSDH